MPETYMGKLLSIELSDTKPVYYRLRVRLDDPADATTIRRAPNFTTVTARNDAGHTLAFRGLVEIEDADRGIIVGNFDLN